MAEVKAFSPNTDKLNEHQKQAIMMHPDFRTKFDAAIAEARLKDSEHLRLVRSEAMSIDYALDDLGLSETELVDFVNKPFHEVTSGMVIMAIRHLRRKKYAATDLIPVNAAVYAIEAEIKAIIEPMRDELITEFWRNKTKKQLEDVTAMANQMQNGNMHNGLAPMGKPGKEQKQ